VDVHGVRMVANLSKGKEMNETLELLDEVISLLEASSAKTRAIQRRLAKKLKAQQKIAERRFKGELAASFDELGKQAEEAFLDNADKYVPDEVVQEAAEDGQLIASIMAKLKVSEFVARELLPKYEAEYLAILKGTYNDVATTLNIGLNLPDPVMRNILAEGGKRVGLLDLEEGTRAKLFDILEEGRSQGLGSDALARLIRDEIPAGPWSSSTIRAEVIARTETKYAQNMSAMESYRNSPAVTGVDLINAGQDPCPICQDIAANGPYSIDTAEGIDLHPNCLCVWSPHLEEF